MRLKLKSLVSRYGRKGAAVLVILPILLIGGGATYAAVLIGGGGQNSVNLNDGLIGHWKLDGDGRDSSPHNRNGAVNGAVAGTDRKGNIGGALSFDGTDDSVSFSDFDSTVLTSGNEDASWTYSVWVYTTASQASDRVVMGKWSCNSGIITNGTPGGFAFRVSTTNCFTGHAHINASSLPLNTWHLLTATYDNRSLAFYVDGALQGTATLPAESVIRYSSSSFGIGGGGAWFFNGLIDDARVYNRALSANEAAALYSQYNPALKMAAGAKGLVGHWKMDGNANDSTPFSHHGTINGALATEDRKNKAGSAMAFNGTSDYIDLGHIQDGATEFTWSAWVKTSQASVSDAPYNVPVIIGTTQASGNSKDALLTVNQGKLTFYYESTTGSTTVSSPSVINDNSWHHVAVVANTSQITIYVDGVNVNSVSFASMGINSNGLQIAKANWSSNRFFGGSIDDVRIYGRALSPGEVQSRYSAYDSQISLGSGNNQANSVNLTNGLISKWDFNGNALDSQPYSNHGTVTGATLTSGRDGSPNGAYNFTSGSYIEHPTSGINSEAGTVSGWVKPNATNSWGFWSTHAGGTNYPDWIAMFSYTGGGTFYFRMGNGSVCCNNDLTFSTSAQIPAGQWSYLTFTWDSTAMRIYVNGAQIAQRLNPATQSIVDPVARIGYAHNIPMNGVIDNLRIYNRALTAAEVQALYEDQN